LPFYHLKLTARKPVPSTVMAEPRTWGEHLRRQRILRGLTQQKVANEIRVSHDTIIHWETGKTAPQVRHVPRVIAFLGYCPWTSPRHAGERFRQVRVALGLTQEAAARRLGVDPATVASWETARRRPPASYRYQLLELASSQLNKQKRLPQEAGEDGPPATGTESPGARLAGALPSDR
jgi:transcriptional regulator with XRE-family HTH domain